MNRYARIIRETEGLVCYWRLGGTNPTVEDQGPAGLDLQTVGTPTRDLPSGVFDGNGAASFPTGARFVGPVSPHPQIADTFTVELWLTCPPNATTSQLEKAGHAQIYIFNRRLFLDRAVGGPVAFTAAVMDDGVWRHVAVTKDGPSSTLIYVDGVEGHVNSSDPALVFGQVTGQVTLGAQANGSFAHSGRLCDVSIYDRALGAGEVVAHYLAGVAAPRAGLVR